jgi:hypothetical protein
MRKLTLQTVLVTSLAFASTLACANEPQPTPLDPTPAADAKPTFEALDTNKDGQIAKTEVPADHELTTLFANFDDDANQNLSRIEFDEYATEDEEEAE